jgi:hypothetical protein
MDENKRLVMASWRREQNAEFKDIILVDTSYSVEFSGQSY